MSTTTPRRRHRGLRAFVIVIVVLVIVVVVAEVLVRQRADAAVADANRSLPSGASAALDSSPVLWQLATGGFDLSLTADDAALTTIVAKQSGIPGLTITSASGALTLTLPVTALGVSVPFSSTLDASARGGQLILTPTKLAIGGVSVDATTARSALAQLGGGAETILDGIRLPSDGSYSITTVAIGDHGATVAVRVPLSTALNGRLTL